MTLLIDSFRYYYPYIQEVKGIDFTYVKAPCYERPFFTANQVPIAITLQERFTEIYPTDIRTFAYMRGSLNDLGQVMFKLRTRDSVSNIPIVPDLLAKYFVIASLNYFQENGQMTNSWLCEWPEGGTNYGGYLSSLSAGNYPEQAVWHTWSGNLARELGFTRANILSLENPVKVIFES